MSGHRALVLTLDARQQEAKNMSDPKTKTEQNREYHLLERLKSGNEQYLSWYIQGLFLKFKVT